MGREETDGGHVAFAAGMDFVLLAMKNRLTDLDDVDTDPLVEAITDYRARAQRIREASEAEPSGSDPLLRR